MSKIDCGCVHRVTILDAHNKPKGLGNTYCALHDPKNLDKAISLSWREIVIQISAKVGAPDNLITKIVIEFDSAEVTYIDLPNSSPRMGIRSITVKINPLNWQD